MYAPAHGAPGPAAPVLEPCIALVDAGFLSWLHGGRDDEIDVDSLRDPDTRSDVPAEALRVHLSDVLGAALRAARLQARVIRVVWYTSQPGAASVPGQVVRLVPLQAADGGVGLVLAMARDALQLAEQRACAHLLIASDDDRLLATMDAVQARGMRVHLLADNAAANLGALENTDAPWAALLRQADTRLIVEDFEHPPHRVPRRERAVQRPEADAGDLRAIPALVQAWLKGLSEATWLMLQAQLPEQRGLPQEADRELLQQISHHLGRPLSVPERKLMRELAREALVFRGLPQDEG